MSEVSKKRPGGKAYGKLVRYAHGKRYVVWYPSRTVERLEHLRYVWHWNKKNLWKMGVRVVARNLITGHINPIFPVTKEGGPRNFHYQLANETDKVIVKKSGVFLSTCQERLNHPEMTEEEKRDLVKGWMVKK